MISGKKLMQGPAPLVHGVLVMGLLGLAAALRLYDLGGESLWYDEAYSVWTSAMPIASLRTLWDWQVEFPLYYLMLHYWMRLFGRSEVAVRGLSALAGALTVVPVFGLGALVSAETCGRRRVAWLAALLLAVNPYHIWYSQEARMFAWATLVATFAMYAFVRAARGGSWLWWAMQGVCIGLTMHLHYYVVWLLCAQDVFLLVILWRSRHRGLPSSGQLLRGALLSHALFVLLAAPAVAVYLTKSRTYNQWGWLADRYGAPGLENLATLAQVFLGGVAVPNVPRIVWPVVLAGVAMAALGAFAALRALFRADDTRLAAAVCAVCLCVPLVIVLVIGQFRPFWIPRHLLLFLPLFLILLSMGIDVLAASGSLGWCTGLGIATAVLALGLIGGARIYGQPQKEQWREVAAYLDATRRHDDRLVLMDAECRVPLAHYGGEPADVEISRFASADELSNAVSALRDMPEGSRIHAVVSHADASALYTLLDAASELELEAQPHFVGIEVRTYRWL